MSGTIPSEFGGLTSIVNMWLSDNDPSGEVPDELADLADLTELYLNGQTGCLTAASQSFADWLAEYDPGWNDGC